jgi:hypothetical protein
VHPLPGQRCGGPRRWPLIPRERELPGLRARGRGEQVERLERLREAAAVFEAREQREREDLLRPLLVGRHDDPEHGAVEAALARARQVHLPGEGGGGEDRAVALRHVVAEQPHPQQRVDVEVEDEALRVERRDLARHLREPRPVHPARMRRRARPRRPQRARGA